MENNQNKKWPRALFSAALILALVFILFWNVIPGRFTLDDHAVIERRVELRNLTNIPQIFLMGWHPGIQFSGTYRPLTLASFAINFLFSPQTSWFHVVSIILYGLDILLIYHLARRLSSARTSWLTAALFLFLPIHVEAVSSIVGRIYLLGGFFYLLALIFYFDRKYALSSASFLLAVLASDFSISFIPLVGLLLLYETRSFWRSLRYGLFYLPSLGVYFLFRHFALGKYALGGYGFIDPVIGPLAFVPFKERVLTALSYLFMYLKKTFYPVGLTPDYSFDQVPIVHSLTHSLPAVIGILFLAVMIAFIIKGRKLHKLAAFLFIMPYIFISNIFFVTTGVMAERWWFLPSLGLVFLTAIGLNHLIEWRGKLRVPVYVFLVVIFSWFSFLIIKQNRIWLNDRNLFLYAAHASPMSVSALTNAAAVYYQEGRYDEARKEISAALKIYDKNQPTLNLWAKINWREGAYQEAETALRKAIDADTTRRNLHSLNRALAILYLDMGRNQDALRYMGEALQSPIYGDIEKVRSTDELVHKIIKKYENRDPRSYTTDEKNEIQILVAAVLKS